MGPIQGSINQLLTLGAAAQKVGAHLKQQKQIAEQDLEPWQKEFEGENQAIHDAQVKRVEENRAYPKGVREGLKTYAPEDVWMKAQAENWGPRPYTPALFGADGFEMHDPKLAQSLTGEKVMSGAEKGINQAQQSINNKATQKQVFDQRRRTAKKRAGGKK